MKNPKPFGLNFLEIVNADEPKPADPKPTDPKKKEPERRLYTQAMTHTSSHDTM